MTSKKVWVPSWDKTSKTFTRVSGAPIGLAATEWPNCKLCNTPLSFIGQLEHGIGDIQLKKDSHVLFIFMCRNFDSEEACEEFVGTLDNCKGTHKILIRDPDSNEFTPPPDDLTQMEEGMGLVNWDINNEQCPTGLEDHLLKGFNETSRSAWPFGESWSKYVAQSETYFKQTKIGGFPIWIQEPWFNDDPENEWQYVAQFTDVNNSADETIWSTLDSGILFLLKNGQDEYELYYQGR